MQEARLLKPFISISADKEKVMIVIWLNGSDPMRAAATVLQAL
jgi:hypothetical protein